MPIPVYDDFDMNTNRVTDTSDPLVDTDAATKRYVDNEIRRLDWKYSVRVATTGNVNLAAPGASIDGAALVAGDRFLAWQQTAPAENGIYVWNGAAVPATRATDADNDAEVTAQMVVGVAEGTIHGDRTFKLITNDPITVGVTALTFTVDSPGRYEVLVGDGVTMVFNINHNFGVNNPGVRVVELATGDFVVTRVTQVNTNTVQVRFIPAPAANAMRIVVVP